MFNLFGHKKTDVKKSAINLLLKDLKQIKDEIHTDMHVGIEKRLRALEDKYTVRTGVGGTEVKPKVKVKSTKLKVDKTTKKKAKK